MKRLTGIMIVILCCVLILSCCAAEVTADTTEANGKVTQIEWKNEDGKLTAGPEGYAKVRYSYKGGDKTEMYFDAISLARSVTSGSRSSVSSVMRSNP